MNAREGGSKNRGFSLRPWALWGPPSARTVIRKEKNNSKRPSWQLCQRLSWQSPQVCLCVLSGCLWEGLCLLSFKSCSCPRWRQRSQGAQMSLSPPLCGALRRPREQGQCTVERSIQSKAQKRRNPLITVSGLVTAPASCLKGPMTVGTRALRPMGHDPALALHETHVCVRVSERECEAWWTHRGPPTSITWRNICFLQNIHSIRCFTARNPFF